MPHFHVVVAGMDAGELKKTCRKLYVATMEVEEPVHIKDAPTPKNALFYSLKHIDDLGFPPYEVCWAQPAAGVLQFRWVMLGRRTTVFADGLPPPSPPADWPALCAAGWPRGAPPARRIPWPSSNST